jgi:hypothetical protein
MIYLGILVNNPWVERFDSLWYRSGVLSRHKAWEVQVCRCRTFLELSANYTVKQDHAGFNFTMGFFGYDIAFTIYDTRHWNYDLKTWEKHSE